MADICNELQFLVFTMGSTILANGQGAAGIDLNIRLAWSAIQNVWKFQTTSACIESYKRVFYDRIIYETIGVPLPGSDGSYLADAKIYFSNSSQMKESAW